MQLSFLIKISMNLFCRWRKVFILMNEWINGESLMENDYPKIKIFIVI